MNLPLRTVFALALIVSLAVIGFVQFAEHVQGYEPCELCLRERLPWDVAIGLGAIGLAYPRRWILVLLGVTFLVSAGLGLHHAGVEQHWWAGPSACTGGPTKANSVAELRAMMAREKVVQCDAIAWTFLGPSMAAWNFLLSLGAAAAAFLIAFRGRHAV